MEDILFKVVSNRQVASGVFRLDLSTDAELPLIWAGQFLHIEVPDNRLILRRPFCIYNYTKNTVTTFYAVVGKGTVSLSTAKQGDTLRAILPLGNGFTIDNYKKIALVGGGMGCAELFNITHTPDKEFYAYFGFSNADRVLFVDDFAKTTKKLEVYTSNGSFGLKGRCTEGFSRDLNNFDAVLVCGPTGLVKSVAEITKDVNIPVFVSLEQRMGCGVGACLVCTCAIKQKDGEVKNKRVCMDGPIFNLKDIVL